MEKSVVFSRKPILSNHPSPKRLAESNDVKKLKYVITQNINYIFEIAITIGINIRPF